jgi:hypothetical protein
VHIPKIQLRTNIWLTKDSRAPLDLFYSFSRKTGMGVNFTKLLDIYRENRAYPVESRTVSDSPTGMRGELLVKLRKLQVLSGPVKELTLPTGYVYVPMK